MRYPGVVAGYAHWIAIAVLGVGCTFGSSGGDGNGDTLAGGQTQTSGTTGASGISGPAGPTSAGSAEGTSAGTSATSSGPGSTGDPTDPTDSDPTTTMSTGTGDDTAESTGNSTVTEPLQNAPQAACDGPFWCVNNGDPGDPTGGPMAMQECFTATLTPPFDLVTVNYEMWMVAAQMGAFELQVRARNGNGSPGNVIDTVPLDPGMHANEGANTLTLDPPITIESQEFCVGFDAPLPGLQSALGLAVDVTFLQPNTSYLGYPANHSNCPFGGFTDIATLDNGNNGAGNWCLDVVIAQ